MEIMLYLCGLKRNVVAVTGIRTARLKRESGENPEQNPLL